MNFKYLFCLLTVFLSSPTQGEAQENVSVEHPVRSYIDDEDQRPLADLKFHLQSDSSLSVELLIAAHGEHVESISGYRGVFGFNRYTAEELDLILLGRHSTEVVSQLADGDIVKGKIRPGSFGRLPERRLRRDGTVDYLHRSRRLPLNIRVLPTVEGESDLRTVVILDGQPRLRFHVSVANQQLVVRSVESLGHDGYIAQDHLRLADRWTFAAVDDVAAPVDLKKWESRDREGRWVLMSKLLDQKPESIQNWVPWLVNREEYKLLEWLAIYRMDAFKSHGVGVALAKASAPNWIRVAAWHENTPPYVGHGRQMAAQLLADHEPEIVLHWLNRYREVLDNWKPGIEGIFGSLKSKGIQPKDSSDYLPPLKLSDVFQHLDAPQDVPSFGDNLNAAKDVVYEHQVVRAINALVISGRRLPTLQHKVTSLIDHSNQRIRIEALLAHSYILNDNGQNQRRFLEIIDDREEPDAVRDAAALAVSFQTHPAIILKLHQIAADPDHAAWKAATSRLGDLGGIYTQSVLDQLETKDLTQEQKLILKQSKDNLKRRQPKFQPHAWTLAHAIRMCAMAEVQNHPHATLIEDSILTSAADMQPGELKLFQEKCGYQKLQQASPIWIPEDTHGIEDCYEQMRKKVITAASHQ